MNLKSMLLAGGFALAAGAAGAADKPEALRLGIFTFTSGAPASLGLEGAQGAEVIISEINAAGGVDGVPVEAITVDEALGGETVVAEFRRLAADPGVGAMIAALSSGNCLALAPVADQMKIPTAAWNCDTHQLFLNAKPEYMFRPGPNTVMEFIAYAAYTASLHPDAKRIAIINPDYAFGHDASAIFQAAMKIFAPEAEVVVELFTRLGTTNFNTEISRIAAARPDIVFSNLWGGDLESFVRQAEPRGVFSQSQVVLALGETILQRVKLPDGVIIGVLGDGWFLSEETQSNPQAVAFIEAYHTKYGTYPIYASWKMANTILVMVEAYNRAIKETGGWPGRDDVQKQLVGLEMDTLTGHTVIREDHDGLVDQVVGVTGHVEGYDFPVMTRIVRYSGAALAAPVGQNPIEWIPTIGADFLSGLPTPPAE